MSNKTLGFKTVTTAGTPVRVSDTDVLAMSYMIQQHEDNTGKGYVGGSASMNRTTGVDFYATIPPNTSTTITAFVSSTTNRIGPFNLKNIWLDSSVNAQKFLISYIEVY